MSNEGGPWGRQTQEARRPVAPPPARRFSGRGVWILLLVAGLAVLVFALARAFPDQVQTRQDWGDVAYYAGFAVLVGTGFWRLKRHSPFQLLRYGAIWVAIFAVLTLGYAYREELAGVPRHLALAFGAGQPVVVGHNELAIPEDDRGSFDVAGKVNGQTVRFMVDTGSTDTVLTPADARRLGIDLSALRFVEPAETANGVGYGAPYVVHDLEVGPIRLQDVHVLINKAPMSRSLLGRSFLDRLDSFEIRGRRLYLRWGADGASPPGA